MVLCEDIVGQNMVALMSLVYSLTVTMTIPSILQYSVPYLRAAEHLELKVPSIVYCL